MKVKIERWLRVPSAAYRAMDMLPVYKRENGTQRTGSPGPGPFHQTDPGPGRVAAFRMTAGLAEAVPLK